MGSRRWKIVLAASVGLAVVGGGVLLGAPLEYAIPIAIGVALYGYAVVFEDGSRGGER